MVIDASNASVSRLMKAVENIEQAFKTGSVNITVTKTEVDESIAVALKEEISQMESENQALKDRNEKAKLKLDNLIERMEAVNE